MAVRDEYINLLVGIPGFTVTLVTIREFDDEDDREDNGPWLFIALFRLERRYRCPCGREFSSYYDRRERSVRDLSYGPYRRSYLCFSQMRVNCPECGVVTERLDWVDPRVNYTKRLAAEVALSCRETRSLSSIARQFGLHAHTVKQMDRAALEAELPSPAEAMPRLLGVDEFSVKKHHHYATAVEDLERRTIPYVAEGRTKESLAGFYQALGPEKCAGIEAVAMDLWPAYQEATREYCPHAELVYDFFHLLQAYGRDVIDKVRVQEFNRASAEHKAVIKGTKYLLLKNPENLPPVLPPENYSFL
jgi:transposase